VREIRGEVRREPTETLLGAFREGAEQRDDGLWPKSPPEVRAAALQGMLRGRRMSSLWPVLGAAGIPVLLVTATEPPESREQSDEAQGGSWPRFRARTGGGSTAPATT
jgi:hypothetical protein